MSNLKKKLEGVKPHPMDGIVFSHPCHYWYTCGYGVIRRKGERQGRITVTKIDRSSDER